MLNRRTSTGAHQRPSLGEMADFAEAVLALSLASLAIALLPFRMLMRTIASPHAKVGPIDVDRASDEVTRAIRRAERRLPLRIVCLHKGLAAHWMLRRRGVAAYLHYGISPTDQMLKAPVWVDVGGKTVFGEDESLGYARVATFPAVGTPPPKR